MVWKNAFVFPFLILLSTGCDIHKSHRSNPFDPEMTPPVELLSVTLDRQQGTAILTWSQYDGPQSFEAYQIDRRIPGVITTDIRGRTTDITETTFIDTMVEADRAYVYGVSVVNAAGLESPSNTMEIFFSFESPQLLQVAFASGTASAALSWNRAMSGFARYAIQRQVEGREGVSIVYNSNSIDDTTFTDRGLEGNTEYRYTLVTRSTTGRELEGTPVGGKFHALLREWSVPTQMTGGIAVDPENRVYASSTNPNQIYQFTSQGELLGQFPIDPLNSDCISLFLSADDHGMYAVVLDLEIGAGYVNAFDTMGERRFRWPSVASRLLWGTVVSPDGYLWVAQSNSQNETSTLYALDVTTGEPIDALELQMQIQNGISISDHVGVAVVPSGDEAGFGIFDRFTGEILRKVGSPGSGKGEFNFSVASAFGVDGRLYIVDGGNGRIQVFRDGEYLTMWGQNGDAPGSFEFSGPSPFGAGGFTYILAGIAVDSRGEIYVADTFNNRIQVFEP